MRHWLTLWLALASVSCAEPTRHAALPPTTPPPPPIAPAGETQVTAIGTECVSSAGESQTTTRRSFGPNRAPGSSTTLSAGCSMSATCIAQQGVQTPGDGLVEVRCDEHGCACRIEVFDARPATRTFSFVAECNDTEQAERLLKERCIPAARHPSHPGSTGALRRGRRRTAAP